jgi:hypothetical protein
MIAKTLEESIKKITNRGSNETALLVHKGETQQFKIYRIPLEFLRLNYLNTRLNMEIKEYERLSGGSLDKLPFAEANKLLHDWILAKTPQDNKRTHKSIKAHGQLNHGVITRDGVIVSGNRRFMTLTELSKKGGDKYKYFRAIVLEDTYSENRLELKLLETSLQLGADKQVDYSVIDKYIQIMEYVDDYVKNKNETMTYDEVGTNMGMDVKEVKKKYSTGKLMLEYLEYIGFPEMYSRLDNSQDFFLRLYDTYTHHSSGKGAKAGWDYSDEDIENFKTSGFDIIRWNYNLPDKKNTEWTSQNVRSLYFVNSGVKSVLSYKDAYKPFQKTMERLEEEEFDVPDLNTVAEREGLSEADAAKKIDKMWAEAASPVIMKALGTARSKINDKRAENQPEDFIRVAMQKLRNIIDVDLFDSKGMVEFNADVIKTLSRENKIAVNQKNSNSIRKIAEALKKELS